MRDKNDRGKYKYKIYGLKESFQDMVFIFLFNHENTTTESYKNIQMRDLINFKFTIEVKENKQLKDQEENLSIGCHESPT